MPILKKKVDKAQTTSGPLTSGFIKQTLKQNKSTTCVHKKISHEPNFVTTCPFKGAILNSFSDDRSFSETFHNKSIKVLLN